MFDIAIIGSGIAAVSAALTAKQRNKSFLILGNPELGKKYKGEHKIFNYPGLSGVTAKEFGDILSKQLTDADIRITEEMVNTVYAMGESFTIVGSKGSYEAKSVILATGVSAVKTYEGEDKYLGRGVSYCATCDGMIYKDRKVIVIGYSPEEEEEVLFLAGLASEVIYIPVYEHVSEFPSNIKIVKGKIGSIKGSLKAEGVILEDGSEVQADGIFILREQLPMASLVPGLKIDNANVVVDRQMNTNIKGLFACGDITGAPFQYAKAAGEGNIACLSAVSYLSSRQF